MTSVEFTFDERLERASTLPSSWYTDPAVLSEEKWRLFSRTWQLVGRAAQVAEAGDYFTAVIADEPIIVVRGADGRLRALSNVCRHRAGPVTSGEGNKKVFQCGYHGWTYSLDGRVRGTPEFDGVSCFSKETTCLPEFKVDEWAGLVFVNIDSDCAPLPTVFREISDLLGPRDFSGMKLAVRKDWYVECNWKVYVDNYLEGYHIPIVHPGLNREIDYQNYRIETWAYSSIQHSPIRKTEDARLRVVEGEAGNEARFFWVFPNLMLNVYPDNYSTNLIVPLGPERTLTVFEWYFDGAEQSEMREKVRQTVEFSDEVQIEDIRICEAVQRGLRSRFYDRGRYSVKRENGVHHFHGLLSKFMNRQPGQ